MCNLDVVQRRFVSTAVRGGLGYCTVRKVASSVDAGFAPHPAHFFFWGGWFFFKFLKVRITGRVARVGRWILRGKKEKKKKEKKRKGEGGWGLDVGERENQGRLIRWRRRWIYRAFLLSTNFLDLSKTTRTLFTSMYIPYTIYIYIYENT